MAVPFGAAAGDPAFDGFERQRLEPADARPADLFAAHQAARFEDLQVLQNRRQREGEGFGQLADRHRLAAQAFDHGAAGGIGQGVEDVGRAAPNS